MTKAIIKSLGILMVALAAFALGAYQHRVGGWPFNRALLGAFAQQSYKDNSPEIARWVENLKKGGYILYFRHANREKWPEVEAYDLYEFVSGTKNASETSFNRAVCLSQQGIEDAKLLGMVFELLKIPTGRVVSSPSCRARQTATYAFGRFDAIDSAIRFSGHPIEKRSNVSGDSLMKLLRDVEMLPGTNTVISGHSTNLGSPRGVLGVDAASPPLDETGFYILQRGEDKRLTLVFSVKSVGELAHGALNARF